MTPHSLRLRLILVSTIAIIIALTAAGLVLSSLFADHIQRATVRRLTDDFNRLAALVDADAPALALTQPMSDPRFDVPYGDIYWQIGDPKSGEVLRSRSMWDKGFDTKPLKLSGDELSQVRLADPEGTMATGVGRLLSFERADGSVRPLEVLVVEDDNASNAAVAAYRLDLFRALALLALILVGAAWAQVTLGLSPLAAVQRGVSAIRKGETTELKGDFPAEVQPLVTEVNDLMKAQELAIQFARERASDLAHGLRAQLQVFNSQAHRLRMRGDEQAATEIEALTAQMADVVDHQLGLTRLRRRSPNAAAGTNLGATVEKIVATVRKTSRGGELQWEIEIDPAASVALDKSDLSELLGALLENAAKWAAGRVRVTGRPHVSGCEFAIEDDGPGIAEDQMRRLGERGLRLDERRSGSGIGLSIVREIVALNNGTLGFSRAALGGLCVTVRLPQGHLA